MRSESTQIYFQKYDHRYKTSMYCSERYSTVTIA